MNRSKTLDFAIRSVLNQKFKNFEVIVSDNSNNASSLKRNNKIIENNKDARIRYVRPNSWMNMVDHWEFATCHANGEYVLVLTDRFVMCPSALEYIYSKIKSSESKIDVINWNTTSLNPWGTMAKSESTGAVELLDSVDTLRKFITLNDWKSSFPWTNKLPRQLNGCFSREIAARIRKKHSHLFHEITPDYTSGYLMLANTTRFMHCDIALYINHGNKSNGAECLRNGTSNFMQTMNLKTIDRYLMNLPNRLPTVTNLILIDFLRIKELENGILENINLSITNIMMSNYREFMEMERQGTQARMPAYYKQWFAEAEMLPQEFWQEIQNHLTAIKYSKPKNILIRRLVVRYGLHKCIHKMRSIIKTNLLFNDKLYKNVLEAASALDNNNEKWMR